MFCEKCGNKLEPGERFCPKCGNKVDNVQMPAGNAVWHSKPKTSERFSGAGVGIGALAGSSASGINVMTLITGILMLLSTMLPFIDIKLGKLGKLASSFLGDIGDYVNNYKLNFYQLISLIKSEIDEKGIHAALIILMIFVILTFVMAIIASLLNKKALLITSGVMSGICFLLCVACLIAEAHYIGIANEEIAEYTGGMLKIKLSTINGFGLTLLTISTAAHTILSIRNGIVK